MPKSPDEATTPRLISIIIPCRNGASKIGSLIDRLQALKRPAGWAVEIAVGYQRSSDGTLEILREKDVNIVQSDQFGPANARNAAAQAANGELFWFVDADAYPSCENFLLRLVELADRLGTFGALAGPIVLPREQRTNPIAIADHFACWFNWTTARESGFTELFHPGVSLVVKRTVFEELRGFRPDIRVLEDYEFQERLKMSGYPLYFSSELAVCHWARDDMTSTLKHSFWWGLPFREAYLLKERPHTLLARSKTALRIASPALFLRRLALVIVPAMKVSAWQTFFSLPFILATVGAWTIGVAVASGQPSTSAENV